jgi:hypothetical protein
MLLLFVFLLCLLYSRSRGLFSNKRYNNRNRKTQTQQNNKKKPPPHHHHLIYNTSLRNSCNLREIADGRLLMGDGSASPGWPSLFSPETYPKKESW